MAAAAAYVENGDKALSLTGGTPSQSVPVGSEEPQDSGAMDPATVLDENAQPLDGDGSEESPYRFLIPDTAQITAVISSTSGVTAGWRVDGGSRFLPL